jgi:hypothetical protein
MVIGRKNIFLCFWCDGPLGARVATTLMNAMMRSYGDWWREAASMAFSRSLPMRDLEM